MERSLVNHYARMADGFNRDPYGPDGGGRATVVNGRGFQLYKRFNPQAQYVVVTTLDGKMVELTRKQADVLDLARTYIDGEAITMRQLADILKVAPSTVWRALVKLTSLGLIAYITSRGHYGGTFIFSRGKNDRLEYLQRAAKDKVRKWQLATQARFSRLVESVAPIALDGKRGVDSLYYYFIGTKGATIKPWTADDMAEIV